MSEVILKNSNLKKTELTYASSSIIYDSLKEFIYSKYNGDCLKIDIFGNIDNDFRAIAVIAAMDNENDEIIHKLNLKFFDKKYDYGEFNLAREVANAKSCVLLKLKESEILTKILSYISFEKFMGSYFSKGRFIGENINNLKFIGVCGDLKNEKYIEKINLLDLIKHIGNIENLDDFYITKFISDCM